MDDDFMELGETDLVVTHKGFIDKKTGQFVTYEELEKNESTEEDTDRPL